MQESEIKVIEKDSFYAIGIKDIVSTMKLGKVMGPAYFKIKEYIAQNSAEDTANNHPFCIYRNVSYDNLDKKGPVALFKMMFVEKWNIEMGIPCSRQLEGTSELEFSEFPGGRYIQAIHTGPYRNFRET